MLTLNLRLAVGQLPETIEHLPRVVIEQKKSLGVVEAVDVVQERGAEVRGRNR